MKTFGSNLKRIILLLCLLVVGIFGLVLLVMQTAYPIQSMKVFVETPTNAPAWAIAAAATNDSAKNLNDLFPTNNWFTEVPYDQATNKFVSEADIAEIRQVIPWHKTVLRLYRPNHIVIK